MSSCKGGFPVALLREDESSDLLEGLAPLVVTQGHASPLPDPDLGRRRDGGVRRGGGPPQTDPPEACEEEAPIRAACMTFPCRGRGGAQPAAASADSCSAASFLPSSLCPSSSTSILLLSLSTPRLLGLERGRTSQCRGSRGSWRSPLSCTTNTDQICKQGVCLFLVVPMAL